LLVKVAPDLTPEQISALARDLRSLEVDGAIATNTTTDRSALTNTPAAAQAGGLSGCAAASPVGAGDLPSCAPNWEPASPSSALAVIVQR